MKSPILFSCALLLSVVCSISCRPVSDLKDGVEEHVESSTPLEAAGKNGEAEVNEKTAEPDTTSTETRVERSSQPVSDKTDDNVESKIDTEAESGLTMAIEHEGRSTESAKVDDKMADSNDAAEEMSSERSGTGLNDAGVENKDAISMRSFKNSKEVNEKSGADQSYASRETTRSMHYDTHELVDSKARITDNSEENFEIQARSDLEALNTDAFGSRRSYSGLPASPGFVTSSRSGLMFDDVPLPLQNQNPAMFKKHQEQMQPHDYFKTSSSEYKAHNGLDPMFDPLSSRELKPLEQFNSNPFSSIYPYGFQPPTNPNPSDNRYQEEGLLSRLVQPLDNLNAPLVRFLGQNLKPQLPIQFKPLGQNIPFPVFRPFDNSFNQLSTQPQSYYKKCNYCNYH